MRHLRAHEALTCCVGAAFFIVSLVIGAEGQVIFTVAAGIDGFLLAVMTFFVGRVIELREQTEYFRSLRNLR